MVHFLSSEALKLEHEEHICIQQQVTTLPIVRIGTLMQHHL